MRTSPITLLASLAFFASLPLLFAGCTPSGSGADVTADGYSAPTPVSPIEATERMRSQYREFR